MRVLVTGAHGFVGSHLAPALADGGHELFLTDRGDNDLAVPGAARALICRESPDYVIHLAARYGRLLCRDAPFRAVTDNAAVTTEVAAACSERGIGVMYASSSEIYGDHGTEPISVDSEPLMPTTIYGLSKRWGEEALRLYLSPDDLCIVRLNMLYGPGQRGGYGCCALATFIRNAMEGEPLTVHRGTTRSWLYISDAVRALVGLVGRGGTYNLGSTLEPSPIRDAANIVCEEVGSGRVIEVDVPEGQIAHKRYVTNLPFDWEPQVPLREGIRATVEAAHFEGIRDYQAA